VDLKALKAEAAKQPMPACPIPTKEACEIAGVHFSDEARARAHAERTESGGGRGRFMFAKSTAQMERESKREEDEAQRLADKRDMFAAAALTGLLSRMYPVEKAPAFLDAVECAFAYADAMMAAREGGKP
jgi:hypothetical protein